MTIEEEKDKIITDLFNSKTLHVQVLKICVKNRILPETFIQEDIISETFYHLIKVPAAKIIAIHASGNLLGFAVRICIRKGILRDTRSPMHNETTCLSHRSVATNIFFASNLNKKEVLEDYEKYMPAGNSTDERFWIMIKENLTKTDNLLLENILYSCKRRGRYKNHVKVKRDKLFQKIKTIVETQKINL